MVTWGENTIHSFQTNQNAAAPPAPSLASSPSAFNFGSSTPAPSPGGSSLFGNSLAPAPIGSSMFGSSTAPAPSTGRFGSSPAPSTGLFGSSPAPGSSLFGGSAPAPSSGSGLFGSSPGTGLFGTQPQQQQLQHQQMPAQAALLAHIDASARQESERVRAKLENIFLTYTGRAVIPEGSDESSKFVAVTYNEMTPEQKQMQIMANISLIGLAGAQKIMEPSRPPQVSPQQWRDACVNNPDPNTYIPVALVGAAALQGRLSWQQEQATSAASNARSVQQILDFIRNREIITHQLLYEKERKYVTLRNRLMEVMKKVDVVRAMNKPLQQDEFRAFERLQTLLNYTAQMGNELTALQDQAHRQRQAVQNQGNALVMLGTSTNHQNLSPDLEKLNEQDKQINKLADEVKKDRRDVELIGKRVVSTISRYH